MDISIVDFSSRPLGRYRSDGDSSGECFREDVLVPALRKSTNVIRIHLDGVAGYPSSFLDEAFGGLVRHDGYRAADLFSRLKFVWDDEIYGGYESEIRDFIEEADGDMSEDGFARKSRLTH